VDGEKRWTEGEREDAPWERRRRRQRPVMGSVEFSDMTANMQRLAAVYARPPARLSGLLLPVEI